MKMEYKLSEKAKQAGIIAGQDLAYNQTLQFQPSEISEKARQLWVQIFGSATYATLRSYKIHRGTIYDDGLADDTAPFVGSGDTYEADKVLTSTDLEAVLQDVVTQKQALEAELPQRKEAWQKARQAYEQRKAQGKAEREQAEAEKAKAEKQQKQRYAELPWVKTLTQKLAVTEEAHAEISRFCAKFSLAPEDLQVQNISDKPYVRLTATVPIQVAGMERDLKISNRTYEDVGDEEYMADEWKSPEFSDFAHAVAKGLAEILSGKVVTVCNYERGDAWLNVVSEGDTVEVASSELEREDC